MPSVDENRLSSVHTSNLPELFDQLRISLAVSTYQAGKVVVKARRIVEKVKTGRHRASFKAKGGRGPFGWSITSGAFPAGLNFDTSTGAITGIPTQSGDFPFTMQVVDALGGIDSETVTLRIK